MHCITLLLGGIVRVIAFVSFTEGEVDALFTLSVFNTKFAINKMGGKSL